MSKKTIALVGNPNVGKSTVFNALTGMKQHTGNWPGKTVTHAVGQMKYKDITFRFVDLPGTYSLSSSSPDEMVTREYITSGEADLILVVVDATCLQRNLLLVKDLLAVTRQVVVCLNLMDEAEKKGISVNVKKLQNLLGVPVIGTVARSEKGLPELLEALYAPSPAADPLTLPDPAEIYSQCVALKSQQPHSFDRRLDRIVTSKSLGIPIMILLLILIFWITMVGANYPSSALSSMFAFLDEKLRTLLSATPLPAGFTSLLMDGVYTTLTWVISVMLPPMAIFFPLFTLLEDFGYLPRVAFNLDNAFKSCGAHGKQALTMWLVDLGCQMIVSLYGSTFRLVDLGMHFTADKSSYMGSA